MDDRAKLLNDIERGRFRLRPTVTNDKSGPCVKGDIINNPDNNVDNNNNDDNVDNVNINNAAYRPNCNAANNGNASSKDINVPSVNGTHGSVDSSSPSDILSPTSSSSLSSPPCSPFSPKFVKALNEAVAGQLRTGGLKMGKANKTVPGRDTKDGRTNRNCAEQQLNGHRRPSKSYISHVDGNQVAELAHNDPEISWEHTHNSDFPAPPPPAPMLFNIRRLSDKQTTSREQLLEEIRIGVELRRIRQNSTDEVHEDDSSSTSFYQKFNLRRQSAEDSPSTSTVETMKTATKGGTTSLYDSNTIAAPFPVPADVKHETEPHILDSHLCDNAYAISNANYTSNIESVFKIDRKSSNATKNCLVENAMASQNTNGHHDTDYRIDNKNIITKDVDEVSSLKQHISNNSNKLSKLTATTAQTIALDAMQKSCTNICSGTYTASSTSRSSNLVSSNSVQRTLDPGDELVSEKQSSKKQGTYFGPSEKCVNYPNSTKQEDHLASTTISSDDFPPTTKSEVKMHIKRCQVSEHQIAETLTEIAALDSLGNSIATEHYERTSVNDSCSKSPSPQQASHGYASMESVNNRENEDTVGPIAAGERNGSNSAKSTPKAQQSSIYSYSYSKVSRDAVVETIQTNQPTTIQGTKQGSSPITDITLQAIPPSPPYSTKSSQISDASNFGQCSVNVRDGPLSPNLYEAKLVVTNDVEQNRLGKKNKKQCKTDEQSSSITCVRIGSTKLEGHDQYIKNNPGDCEFLKINNDAVCTISSESSTASSVHNTVTKTSTVQSLPTRESRPELISDSSSNTACYQSQASGQDTTSVNSSEVFYNSHQNGEITHSIDESQLGDTSEIVDESRSDISVVFVVNSHDEMTNKDDDDDTLMEAVEEKGVLGAGILQTKLPRPPDRKILPDTSDSSDGSTRSGSSSISSSTSDLKQDTCVQDKKGPENVTPRLSDKEKAPERGRRRKKKKKILRHPSLRPIYDKAAEFPDPEISREQFRQARRAFDQVKDNQADQRDRESKKLSQELDGVCLTDLKTRYSAILETLSHLQERADTANSKDAPILKAKSLSHFHTELISKLEQGDGSAAVDTQCTDQCSPELPFCPINERKRELFENRHITASKGANIMRGNEMLDEKVMRNQLVVSWNSSNPSEKALLDNYDQVTAHFQANKAKFERQTGSNAGCGRNRTWSSSNKIHFSSSCSGISGDIDIINQHHSRIDAQQVGSQFGNICSKISTDLERKLLREDHTLAGSCNSTTLSTNARSNSIATTEDCHDSGVSPGGSQTPSEDAQTDTHNNTSTRQSVVTDTKLNDVTTSSDELSASQKWSKQIVDETRQELTELKEKFPVNVRKRTLEDESSTAKQQPKYDEEILEELRRRFSSEYSGDPKLSYQTFLNSCRGGGLQRSRSIGARCAIFESERDRKESHPNVATRVVLRVSGSTNQIRSTIQTLTAGDDCRRERRSSSAAVDVDDEELRQLKAQTHAIRTKFERLCHQQQEEQYHQYGRYVSQSSQYSADKFEDRQSRSEIRYADTRRTQSTDSHSSHETEGVSSTNQHAIRKDKWQGEQQDVPLLKRRSASVGKVQSPFFQLEQKQRQQHQQPPQAEPRQNRLNKWECQHQTDSTRQNGEHYGSLQYDVPDRAAGTLGQDTDNANISDQLCQKQRSVSVTKLASQFDAVNFDDDQSMTHPINPRRRDPSVEIKNTIAALRRALGGDRSGTGTHFTEINARVLNDDDVPQRSTSVGHLAAIFSNQTEQEIMAAAEPDENCQQTRGPRSRSIGRISSPFLDGSWLRNRIPNHNVDRASDKPREQKTRQTVESAGTMNNINTKFNTTNSSAGYTGLQQHRGRPVGKLKSPFLARKLITNRQNETSSMQTIHSQDNTSKVDGNHLNIDEKYSRCHPNKKSVHNGSVNRYETSNLKEADVSERYNCNASGNVQNVYASSGIQLHKSNRPNGLIDEADRGWAFPVESICEQAAKESLIKQWVLTSGEMFADTEATEVATCGRTGGPNPYQSPTGPHLQQYRSRVPTPPGKEDYYSSNIVDSTDKYDSGKNQIASRSPHTYNRAESETAYKASTIQLYPQPSQVTPLLMIQNQPPSHSTYSPNNTHRIVPALDLTSPNTAQHRFRDNKSRLSPIASSRLQSTNTNCSTEPNDNPSPAYQSPGRSYGDNSPFKVSPGPGKEYSSSGRYNLGIPSPHIIERHGSFNEVKPVGRASDPKFSDNPDVVFRDNTDPQGYYVHNKRHASYTFNNSPTTPSHRSSLGNTQQDHRHSDRSSREHEPYASPSNHQPVQNGLKYDDCQSKRASGVHIVPNNSTSRSIQLQQHHDNSTAKQDSHLAAHRYVEYVDQFRVTTGEIESEVRRTDNDYDDFAEDANDFEEHVMEFHSRMQVRLNHRNKDVTDKDIANNGYVLETPKVYEF